jgi:hypothetical protein
MEIAAFLFLRSSIAHVCCALVFLAIAFSRFSDTTFSYSNPAKLDYHLQLSPETISSTTPPA